MSTQFASNLLVFLAKFDTLVTKGHFSQIMYNCRSFYLCGYLDIEYVFKFAEFKHQGRGLQSILIVSISLVKVGTFSTILYSYS